MAFSSQHVTAVVMVDRYPEQVGATITSILHQQPTPQRVVLVATPEVVSREELDQATRDIADAGVDWHVLERPRNSAESLATALATTLVAAEENTKTPPSTGTLQTTTRAETTGWLWLMHDDAVAQPDALSQLLRAVEVSPSVGIAGCKQVELERPRHLLDVGVTVTRQGEPLSLIEPGELDQGQYDDRSDVFAVSAPGLLIRHDVWKNVDGIDLNTPAAGQAVDLCWRVRLAGHRVIVVPDAIIRHDGRDEGLYVSAGERRETSVWLRLKHRPLLTVPLMWLWVLLSTVGGFLFSLIAKEPGTGLARTSGALRSLTRPLAMFRSRRGAAASRSTSYNAIRPLRPEPHQVRAFRRSVIEIAEPDEVIGDGTGSSAETFEPTGGHDDFTALATPERNWVGVGLVASLVLLGGITLLGLHSLLGAAAVSGGGLLPLSGTLSDLFNHAFESWSDAGAGAAAQPGPFAWILLLFGLTGNASVTMLVFLFLAIPLAGAGAWTGAGSVIRHRGARFVIALVWGLAPTLLISLGEGRIGAIMVHAILPWLVVAIIRATGSAADRRLDPQTRGTEPVPRPGHHGVVSWTAAGWTALLTALLTAAAPSLLIPVTVIIVVLSLALRRRGRALWWTPALALAQFLPVLLAHGNSLRAVLGDPGMPVGYTAAPAWQQLLGFPQTFTADAGLLALPWLEQVAAGVPWALIAALVIAVPLLILAVVGVFSTRPAGIMGRIGLLVATVGLATGWVAPHIFTAIDLAGVPVALYTGPAVSLVWAGVMVAALAGFDLLSTAGKGLAPVAAVLVLLSTLVAGTLWVTPRLIPAQDLQASTQRALETRNIAGESDPELSALHAVNLLAPAPVRGIPATAADQGTGPLSSRTLLLQRNGQGITTALTTGTGPVIDRISASWTTRSVTGPLTEAAVANPDDADQALRSLAAELVSGTANDPRGSFHDFGVAFVLLQDSTGADQTTAATLDSIPGLAPVGLTNEGWLWRVVPTIDGGLPVLGDDATAEQQGMAAARARIEIDGEPTQLLPLEHGDTTVTLPAQDADTEPGQRTLVLAERAHPGWQATLNGEELTAITADNGWAQAFEIPEHSGELEITHHLVSPWVWTVPGALLLISLLLAIPSPARRTASRTRDRVLGEPLIEEPRTEQPHVHHLEEARS